MSNTKLIQYIHRPNATEIGMGNTHETYMLIGADTDLSALFPPSVDVKVRDSLSGKNYYLKAANGREFRVNQMGELYRDYNILPGDEIVITRIEKGLSFDVVVNVKQYQRVVMNVSSKGTELVNISRLDPYSVGNNSFEIRVSDRGNLNTLKISFKGAFNKRNDSPTTTDYYDVSIDGETLANGTYYLTIGNNVSLSMLPKSEYNVINLNDDLIGNFKYQRINPSNDGNGQKSLFLTALRTKPFMLLAGISGTGKSRIVRKLAQASVTEELQRMYDPKSVEKGFKRWELHKPANFELIQVKPNWHNSLEVVGYKSNIGGAHYEFTPFVEFVARAWKHPKVPFFLCLDEMNLAPVEQYFAEFLSAIESRSVENGEYETDPIVKPFNSFNTKNDEGIITDNLSDRMIAHLVGKLDTQRKSEIADRFRTKGLTLPQNLLVMGTVNMDETTFSFSRKVLDRAMSVLMNTVEYDKFFSGESEQDVAEMNDETRRLLIDRPIRGLDAEDNGADEVKDYLTAINGELQDTPFQLGYRAANEALLYVSAARAFDPAADIKAALDEFTLMKVLSRIEGDKRSIDDLLARLQNVIDKSYPKSQDKLGKMAETLQKKQFVSYWT
mgnify:CR=1 FL=1